MLLRTAIAEGVEYVDLEDDIAGNDSALRQDQADRSACTISARRPTTWRRSTRGCAGWIRTSSRSARWPTTRTTTCGCCNWCGESKVPTVGICMGDIGTPTRILGRPLRRALHLRHVPSRAGAGAGAAQLPADDRDLSLRPDRRPDRGLRRDRRSGGAQPQPAGPQRGLRAAEAQQGVRSLSRAARGPGAVSSTTPRPGHPGPERHDPAQGGNRQAAQRGRRRGPQHRRGQHGGVPRGCPQRLQHRLPRRHEQPGRSRRNGRREEERRGTL